MQGLRVRKKIHSILVRSSSHLKQASVVAGLHLRANPAWPAQLIQRRLDGSRRVIVVGSAHRVGSTWLFNLLRDLGYLRNAIQEAPSDLHRFSALRTGNIDYHWLAQINGWAILKGHADPPASSGEAALAHFVTIYRDPRDVLVSSCFYQASLPVKQGGLGEAFRLLSPEARIKHLLSASTPTLLTELERWFHTPYAIQVKYEELHARPEAILGRLADDLELAVNSRQITAVVHYHDFTRTTGRARGQEKSDAPERKGIVGDWRNYFSADLQDGFKTAQGGRWQALLEEMGYAW